jgi:UDP-N-acetylglucosamine acyltransferase
MVSLAGITTIMEGTNIGMGCSVHQKSVIGPYVMVATGAPVVKNIRPFTKFIPGKPLGVNTHALSRIGLADLIDQCAAYIHDGLIPTDERLASLTSRFEELHKASDRPVYS